MTENSAKVSGGTCAGPSEPNNNDVTLGHGNAASAGQSSASTSSTTQKKPNVVRPKPTATTTSAKPASEGRRRGTEPSTKAPRRRRTVKKKTPEESSGSADLSEVFSARMSRLENLVESFIGKMYESQEAEQRGVTPAEVEANVSPMDEDSESFLTPSRPEGLEYGEIDSEDFQDNRSVSEVKTAKATPMMGFASRFAGPAEIGQPVEENLASSMNYLITTKVEDKNIMDTCQIFLQPENCEALVVPRVNPSIWDNLSATTRTVDSKLQRCQKPLVKGLTALVSLYDGKELSETEENTLALLSNSLFELNMLRRDLIKPELNQRYAHLCKPSVKTTQWLFGDDLPKMMKDLEEQHKATLVVKAPKQKFQQRFPRMGFMPSNLTAAQQRYRNAGWSSTRPSQSQRRGPFLGPPRYTSQYSYKQERGPLAKKSAYQAKRPTKQ